MTLARSVFRGGAIGIGLGMYGVYVCVCVCVVEILCHVLSLVYCNGQKQGPNTTRDSLCLLFLVGR